MSLFDLFKRKRPQPAPAAASIQPVARVAAPAAPVAAAPAGAGPDDDAVLHGGPERRERDRRNARPGTRILVIDDSPTIVALLKRMLQQNHYAVLVAYDGESGLEIARREVPDLIFLDIVLPGIDGFSALRTLRRDPLTKDVPIIMISGNAQATEQFYVQRIGADDFMKKPFSRPEVFSRIEALLDETGTPRHVARPAQRPGAAAQPATPA
ncbi:response regulator transcription factor [Thermomonas sp.]|uniref:response regulator transcription factor n=1 Tax=Thermomonas sp. TaxID=1971895 RepID=UPI003BDF55B3